ncbi:multiheme c-type cytochrome [Urechidicola sp. KH5]
MTQRSRKFVILLGLVAGLILIGCSKEEQSYSEISKSSAMPASHFVGSQDCKSCHQKEFDTWKGSHHDNAMKVADSITVLGDFNNITFKNNGVSARFFKQENEYFVHTEGIDGTYKDFKIDYTFGIYPLQQYLIAFENGEYQCLTTAWDSKKGKWFSLLDNSIDINHGDWLHWTGGAMSWNTMCADCHSTDLKKNYDAITDTYTTTFSEINVSCEACHGPASAHITYYKEGKTGAAPEMYMHKDMTSEEVVDKCARCHSRRSQITPYFDYQGKFTDHYAPSLLVDGLYELDGQINDEVYVYGSFVQSKMYHNGVSCKDCHDVHSLKLKKHGNDLCLQCHTPDYNSQEHHFHSNNSKGAQCINCHMTGKIYMGNDYRRDHSFRIPRPDQSVTYGTPNACTQCHTDKTDEWAAQVVIDKFGPDRADHFSDHMLKGYFEDRGAFEMVIANHGYPDIVRATALGQFSNQYLDQDQLNNLRSYLKDSSEFVRNEALMAIERLQVPNQAFAINQQLNDSSRVVRISAARYFAMLGEEGADLVKYSNAKKEFLTSLELNADFASGQHQIGLYHQANNNIMGAIKAYERAIEIDGYYNRARMNLALLYYQQGEVVKAENLYLKVVEQEPEFGYSYYMLGLLYNELGNNAEAIKYLKLAIEKEPTNQNAYYNYAIKLQESKDFEASIKVLNKGLQSYPYDERMLYVKLLAEINTNNIIHAKSTCELLLQIAPNNQQYQQIYGRLMGQ